MYLVVLFIRTGALALLRQTLLGGAATGARDATWPKVGVLITDGRSTIDRLQTLPGTHRRLTNNVMTSC